MHDTDRHLHDELARLQEDNQLLQKEVATLRRFSRSLKRLSEAADRRENTEDVMALLNQILNQCLETIGAEDGSLLILDEETRELVFVLTEGAIPQQEMAGLRLPAGKGIAGWVVQNREPTIVENPYNDQRFYPEVDDIFRFRTNSILAAPIVGGGRVLGVLEALNKELGKSFTADDLALLTLLCRFAGELLHSLEDQAEEEKAG